MMSISNVNEDSKTLVHFYKISKFLAIGGMPRYIKWGQSGYSRPIYKYIQNVLTLCLAIFIILELGSLFTQKTLSRKQKSDMLILGLSHLILSSYPYCFLYYEERVKNLIHTLCIELKNVYNDPEVERQMIKKSSIYLVAFLMNLMSALFSYGFDGITQVLHGNTFVTVITAWPDVVDRSTAANICRIVAYLMWWVCMLRVAAVFVLLMVTTECMAFQFKHLQTYFHSLNNIFAEDGGIAIDQGIAERQYEKSLKIGIQLHVDTLWCITQCQVVFRFVYSAHVTITVVVMALLMLQMMSAERTITAAVATVVTAMSVLSGTGILMWNAGDITVEAARLPEAMYSSGWENCRSKSSQRVRKLLVIAMNQAQKPVVLRTFGIMDISYQAFVSLVKACYSAFSLIY